MTLRRKPKTEDEFLSQGAIVPDVVIPETPPVDQKQDKEVRFLARLPAEIVGLIDLDRKSELPRQSRNNWLINAAINELKRRKKI